MKERKKKKKEWNGINGMGKNKNDLFVARD